MNKEPEIFSSLTPHEVHLAEGSHTAVHKTANPMQPQIRRAEVKTDEAEEIISISDGVSVSKLPEAFGLSPDATSEPPDVLHQAAEQAIETNLAQFGESTLSESLGLAPDATSESNDVLHQAAEQAIETNLATFDKSTVAESLGFASEATSESYDVLHQAAEQARETNITQFGESTVAEPLGLAQDATSESHDVLQQAADQARETNIAPFGESTASEPLGLAPDATPEPPDVLQQAAEEAKETNRAPFGESTASEPPEVLQQAAEEDIDPNLAPPEPFEMLMGESPSLDTEQDTSLAAPPETEDFQEPDTVSAVEPTLEPDFAPLEPVAPVFMEEMNFPARVVKLKMANEKIRTQIEALEKPLFAPIVESAPAAKAKGKGKEETKPSKGH